MNIRINLKSHRDVFLQSINSAKNLLDSGQKSHQGLQKQTRGLVFIILFASYEQLIKSVTRSLLENAALCRVKTIRLKPGFMAFAITDELKSLKNTSDKKLYKYSIPSLQDAIYANGKDCKINVRAFPDDGSFMKRSQVELWFKVFDAGNPWEVFDYYMFDNFNTVVRNRNKIAHGEDSPENIGGSFTFEEMTRWVSSWENSWLSFISHIENLGSKREFYRSSR